MPQEPPPEPGMNADHLENTLAALIGGVRTTLRTELTSAWLPAQLGVILAAALIGAVVASLVRRRFDLVSATMGWPGYLRLAVRAVIDNFGVLVFILLVWLTRAAILAAADRPRVYLLDVAINLATAWVVIAVLASMIRNPFANRVISVSGWTLAALSIVGLFDATVALLDSRAIMLGGLRITPLLVLKTTALLLLALWAAITASNFLERRVQAVPDLTPSVQVLAGKLIRIGMMTLAIVIVLSAVGIDLSVLAVLGGAVGVGIGFGLQKIVANFVSGVILLADKSIKPGDVVTVGEHFGWVTRIRTRYTSLDLKDGRELLVPNEDLVTQPVINWSYSSDVMQLQVRFNTTYDSDLRKTQAAAVAAALTVPQVLRQPAPACHLTAFGATSIEYVLWCWIGSAAAGPTRVRSDVMIALWDTLERENVRLAKPGATRVILDRASSPG
jgi:small-conductance mechanosensitive channel